MSRWIATLGVIKSALMSGVRWEHFFAEIRSGVQVSLWHRLGAMWRWCTGLAGVPWSIQQVVQQAEDEWSRFNVERKQQTPSRLERELLFAGEHPFRFAGSLFAFQLALLLLVAVLPLDCLTVAWEKWGPAEQLSFFSTVWTIQATLAALVYPIVISFVAVFLQRRPAAEAFVHLYMLDSGGLAAGLSSLVLVVVMSGQYLMVVSWGTSALPEWTLLDTAWFLLNSCLTTYFLFRTVDFLRPEVQANVVRRYTINVALPRDVARLNLFQVMAHASVKRWLLVPEYGDDKAPAGPRLLFGRYGFRDGTSQGQLHLSEPCRLVNVRLWMLRLVVTGWYRRALRHPRPTEDAGFGTNRNWPLLTIPMTPGSVLHGNQFLVKVADGPVLTTWQLWVLRWSLVLRPVSRERYGIRVEAIMDELVSDARQAALRADGDAFERAHGALVDMHELLLGASLDRNGDGTQGSWALLPDPDRFFSRALHENWGEAYRGIFEAAIHSVVNNTQPLKRLCHLLQHLDGEHLRASPIEIREHLLQLPPLMMYQLGNWWAHRVEEQGIMDHGHQRMVMLRPPLHRVYEEVLSSFVAGWENGRTDSPRNHRGGFELPWTSVPDAARLNAKHIEETARMLLAAVHRGDQAAAEWMADVLSKWWGTFDYDHEPYQLYDKTTFITLDHLGLEWEEFQRVFGIAEPDSPLPEQLTPRLQRGVYLAALRNYWIDIRLLVIELMLHWSRPTATESLDTSLSAEVVAGLLLGKQWRGGGEIGNSLRELSATEYLEAKLRQYAASGKWRGGYVGRLDRFVERIKDMDRPNMVSSRTYSYSGADDVGSLQDSQLELFALLSTVAWGVPRSLQRQIDVWMDNQYRSIDLVSHRLDSWLKRLEEEPVLAAEQIAQLKPRVRPDMAAQDAIEAVKAGLHAVQHAINVKREGALAAEPIDPDRLLEIARFASSRGFSSANGEFPLQFLTIEKTNQPQVDFTLRLQQVRKGELTRVEMDQRAANEADFFAEALAQRVAVIVLSDVLQGCTIRDVEAPNADTYWNVLKVEAAKVIAKGGLPILLLDNATRPEWVWEWQHSDYGASYRRPEDLRVHRVDGRGPAYVCDFNEIEVYAAPIAYGQSLLISKDAFRRVTFTMYEDDSFVRVDVAERQDARNLVDLLLSFSRKVDVGSDEAVRLVYAQK
ncbi:hypothetical protein PWG14_08320 (plasmid) [Chromobacterium amazonense]|uniref:hypothetical protein n=1 Tax=Chromobacterium amazonense TaxID=1382803 RepID=UPI00237EE150|nr:hypothetical protein [Chromobacterium amazonense]MDE1712689.1 hypothetical protein [Chromobacterium amazonense]